jgi:hypothetical protein
MDSFGTFLLQIAMFLYSGMAVHTLLLLVPDNTYEPTGQKLLMWLALALVASYLSFSSSSRST